MEEIQKILIWIIIIVIIVITKIIKIIKIIIKIIKIIIKCKNKINLSWNKNYYLKKIM